MGCNHEIGTKLEEFHSSKLAPKIRHIMTYSSVSAQKLSCPSSARNLFGSAQFGKFQLELLTTVNKYKYYVFLRI